ncbi:hypothetical protein B7R70_06885 [Yersinia pseudotuberculosis]|uniref:DUF4224 domain-containing protein n=1 Tax=Yersinia pseudotuberculosis complex TaxID=1649845 RepID=UPI0005E1F28C|nr:MULTISPECIES: DUF4224 domain-containing protein [Yersinia pseudotuberculosis complex]PSH13666.1 hypothetical protein BLA52_18530 [Yersinia pseudotuberculosis]PSH25343.1 hypothetical protein BLA50_12815 [Yersinia pseudotuberculosis]PSH31882.1 hypothetical protein BLA51_06365 [Yersinia pseudotuberculosis]PSH34064.1 hypothetical protein BA197_13600 [Yersinia pseudotuberculosis]PST80280.1 hypothetical protein B7R70_06885 [Yersinia pseudotuberculosis]
MRNDHDIITKEEMIELTGHHYKTKQCESLRRAGIFFIERPDGHPKTTWGHFLNPVSLRGKHAEQEKEEPDFEAMNSGR